MIKHQIKKHANVFLPYMLKANLDSFPETMFKNELYDSIFNFNAKSAAVDKDESNNSDIDNHTLHKSKLETDQSSSTSKQPSRINSPARTESLHDKLQNLSITQAQLSSILWNFFNERYVPYLELLND